MGSTYIFLAVCELLYFPASEQSIDFLYEISETHYNFHTLVL